MNQLKKVCVFCGSSPGANLVYAEAAIATGKLLAKRGITLVYGGGNIGLMGIVADTVMEQGGKVIGVIPKALEELEVAHLGVTDLRIVESMHERKAMMADLADGFIALPGGFGTFEELCEILTWGQLGYHEKPIGALNVNGFYDHLIGLFDHAVREQFLKQSNHDLLLVEETPKLLLEKMTSFNVPKTKKWIGRAES